MRLFYWVAYSISGRFSFELEVVNFSTGLFSPVNSFFIVSFISCKFDWTYFTTSCCYFCSGGGTPLNLANVAAFKASLRSSSSFYFSSNSFCFYSLCCYYYSKLLRGDLPLSISARDELCYDWTLLPIPVGNCYCEAFFNVSGEFDFLYLVPWRGDGTGEICCGYNCWLGRAAGGLWEGGI